VRSFAELCAEKQMPQPDIITESGRALTAHHAVLITNVTDIESVYSNNAELLALPAAHNWVEHYHDAQFALSEARASFTQDKLSIIELAKAENYYAIVCQQIKSQLNPIPKAKPLFCRNEREACRQSILQFFAVPIHARYLGHRSNLPDHADTQIDEQPSCRAVIQDLTCDSDGRIDQYIDGQNIENTLHCIKSTRTNPILSAFYGRRVSEILGDMHNLFGDTHSINIQLDDQGYHFMTCRKASMSAICWIMCISAAKS